MELSDIKKMYTVKTTGELKTLELTEEQYRRLLLAINLGLRTIVKDDDGIEIALVDIEQYILSFSKEFNSSNLSVYDPESGFYLNTKELKSKTEELINYYNDHIFRYELTKRLARRDIKLSGKTEEELTASEIEQIELKYLDEFIENDVNNLQLLK